jgi:hypothetical protein
MWGIVDNFLCGLLMIFTRPVSFGTLRVIYRSNSCAPLPATSAYFTTSEPKAKLLTRYHNINSSEGSSGHGSNGTIEPVSSELLIKKKVKDFLKHFVFFDDES